MEFIQHLIKQSQQPKQSAKSIYQNTLIQKTRQPILDLEKTVEKEPSQDSETQGFTPIHTLISMRDCRRIPRRPKTLRDFKEGIQPQKYETKRPQSIVSFIEPEFLVKTLFEEHSHTLKINQVKYFSTTKKGLRNFQTLENQDFIINDRIASIFKYFCIFDGFGHYGKTIAQTTGMYFKNCIRSYQEEFKRQISEKQITQIFKICLKKTQTYLHNAKFNEIQYSGTTVLTVVLTPRSIITLNVGNSRCVIGMKDETSGKFYDFQVTHDHDLNRLDERLRVKKKGAIISPLKDELGEAFGPDRLWNKNEKRPGTFITRAFGLACGTKSGVIFEPEVSILSYNQRMKFLVLASDGLWSVEENDEVVELLEHYYRQGELGMGTQSLIEQAINRWKRKVELMDDISIIVIGLCQE